MSVHRIPTKFAQAQEWPDDAPSQASIFHAEAFDHAQLTDAIARLPYPKVTLRVEPPLARLPILERVICWLLRRR